MRILLDESLPSELQSELPGHTVRTVQQQGSDQNLQYQQNLKALPIAVVVLVAKTNRMRELRPLIPEPLRVLAGLKPGTFVRVGG